MRAEISSVVDPKTGERIKKCAIPEVFVKEIDALLASHQNVLNNFMGLSQQYVNINKKYITAESVKESSFPTSC